MSALTVSELTIYPVKSLGAVRLTRMPFDAFGPARDRRYIVADKDGRFVTQRDFPRMTLVHVALREDGIEFSAPAMPAFFLDALPAKDTVRRTIAVWRDNVEACDMGGAIAAWLSSYLGVDVRLYFMPDDSVRRVDPQYGREGDRVSFADGFPVLLFGAESLAEINRALPDPVETLRFRPNIVIAGAEPFAEDKWRRIRIGKVEFDVVKPCSRCVIPSIDLQTAQKQPIVAQTLARLRRRDNAVYFGQNLIPRISHPAREGNEIVLGDAVTIIE